jgi:hypothetical protein
MLNNFASVLKTGGAIRRRIPKAISDNMNGSAEAAGVDSLPF